MHNSALPVAANPLFAVVSGDGAAAAAAHAHVELEQADLGGKLAVLYGELVRHPLPPKAWMFKDDADARVVELLEAKRPAAILTVQNRAGEIERLIEDWEFHVPSATVSAEVGAMLLSHAGEMARLRIDTRQSRGATANVVGRMPGLTASATRPVRSLRHEVRHAGRQRQRQRRGGDAGVGRAALSPGAAL
jgi:aminopeptidase YwaD